MPACMNEYAESTLISRKYSAPWYLALDPDKSRESYLTLKPLLLDVSERKRCGAGRALEGACPLYHLTTSAHTITSTRSRYYILSECHRTFV